MATKRKKAKVKQILHKKQIFLLIFVIFMIVFALAAIEYLRPGSIPFLSWIFVNETKNPVDTSGLEEGKATAVPEAINIADALRAYFIDVGQGDSILLRFPDGTDFLIDGGNGSSASQAEIQNYLARLAATGLDDIEYMIATHPDSDHINMLDDVLKAYEVNAIYYNGFIGTSATFCRFDEAAKSETYGSEDTSAAIQYFDGDGDIYIIENGSCRVTIYAPGYERFGSNMNAMSPVIIAEYGGRKLILTGDAETITEAWFISVTGVAAMDCDVYKAGHHGSRSSSSETFLDFITCEYAIVSCGADNTYGHPHQETIQKLEARSCRIYRTDLNGTITVYIDAEGDMAVIPERE